MSETRIKDFSQEVQQALKEEMMKFAGKPITRVTEIEMANIIQVTLDFYDVPYEVEMYFQGRNIHLTFYRKR